MAKQILVALAALGVLASVAPSQAADARVRRDCRASGAEDISMQARYEARGARKKFTTEFEAAPGGRFSEGDRVSIRVEGVKVGAVRLETVVGGDVVGDLNFDSRVKNDDNPSGDEQPFPADFPTVGRGSLVEVMKGAKVILSCELR